MCKETEKGLEPVCLLVMALIPSRGVTLVASSKPKYVPKA